MLWRPAAPWGLLAASFHRIGGGMSCGGHEQALDGTSSKRGLSAGGQGCVRGGV